MQVLTPLREAGARGCLAVPGKARPCRTSWQEFTEQDWRQVILPGGRQSSGESLKMGINCRAGSAPHLVKFSTFLCFSTTNKLVGLHFSVIHSSLQLFRFLYLSTDDFWLFVFSLALCLGSLKSHSGSCWCCFRRFNHTYVVICLCRLQAFLGCA